MNDLIGKHISIDFNGLMNCCACNKAVKKFFGQGFCYPCFVNAPENSECIIRPELCLGHEGKGRDLEWELKNHVQPHTVYLALTSAVKVGVTRGGHETTRWIDQGAWKAIKFAEVPNRYIAGLIEVEMKSHLADKTNWQKMLKNECAEDVDLLSEKDELLAHLPSEYEYYISEDDQVYELNYPVKVYPSRVKSLNLDKTPNIEGVLEGIRGQYLIFKDGLVINLRKYTGYNIELSVKEAVNEIGAQTSLF